MPFLDEIALNLRAGKGGDGLVHFARVKYQPFAGPDGGDGGRGGSVVLVCDRAVDDLDHLRHAKLEASSGQPGGPNLMIGPAAPDLELKVPPGTLLYAAETQDELAALTGSGQRFVAAKGGDGGKGNPKYATGRRRAPKIAEDGHPGEEVKAQLIYRLYCDTLLLEVEGDTDWALLPRLLKKDPAEVDWELYRRKPRWVRVEHDFRKYDIGYLPLTVAEGGEPIAPLIPHVFWAKRVLVNLCPVAEGPVQSTLALVQSQPRRRMEQVLVAVKQPAAHSEAVTCTTPAEVETVFLQQLTGDIVP
jgi:GTP-binding protein